MKLLIALLVFTLAHFTLAFDQAWVQNFVASKPSLAGIKKFVVANVSDQMIAAYATTADDWSKNAKTNLKTCATSFLSAHALNFKLHFNLDPHQESALDNCINALCGVGDGCPKADYPYQSVSQFGDRLNPLSGCSSIKPYVIKDYTDGPFSTCFNGAINMNAAAKVYFKTQTKNMFTTLQPVFNYLSLGTPVAPDVDALVNGLCVKKK